MKKELCDFMNSFDFEWKSFLDRFHEVEEGVYFKHYGIELPYNEVIEKRKDMTKDEASYIKEIQGQEEEI